MARIEKVSILPVPPRHLVLHLDRVNAFLLWVVLLVAANAYPILNKADELAAEIGRIGITIDCLDHRNLNAKRNNRDNGRRAYDEGRAPLLL